MLLKYSRRNSFGKDSVIDLDNSRGSIAYTSVACYAVLYYQKLQKLIARFDHKNCNCVSKSSGRLISCFRNVPKSQLISFKNFFYNPNSVLKYRVSSCRMHFNHIPRLPSMQHQTKIAKLLPHRYKYERQLWQCPNNFIPEKGDIGAGRIFSPAILPSISSLFVPILTILRGYKLFIIH